MRIKVRLAFAGTAAVACILLGLPATAHADTAFFGPGSQLNPCDAIESPSGDYQLQMQCDGNLTLTLLPENRQVWASGTGGMEGSVLQMQADGNAVVYSPGHIAQWESGTAGNPGSTLAVQDDGNLVVIAPGNSAIWSTGTVSAGQYVDTPGPGAPAHYPAGFDPGAAATWAQTHVADNADVPFDPCTAFVSAAMRAAGMPKTDDWFSPVDAYVDQRNGAFSAPWFRATTLLHMLRDNGWVEEIPVDPRDDAAVNPLNAAPGDLIFYEWNGAETAEHVHMTMVTSFNGQVGLVTQQSGDGRYQADSQWNWSYIQNKPLVQVPAYAKTKAILLHWH
jgi:hypothetical protein